MYGVASFIDEARGSGPPEALPSFVADVVVHRGRDGKGMFLLSVNNFTACETAGTNVAATAGGGL